MNTAYCSYSGACAICSGKPDETRREPQDELRRKKTVEIQKHIVKEVMEAPSRREDDLSGSDVEILDAWLWPATTETSVDEREEAISVEVSLLPPTRRLLRDFPVPGLEQPYLRHLEQRISRNPRDLLSHVRRLYLANALDDADAITGALTDLFLVLGRQGRSLRRRLLNLAGEHLTTEQFGFFVAHLEKGLDENEAIPEIPQSRLSKRVIGTTRIVSRSDNDASDSDDPIQLARDSIAGGHVDVAQAVLEGALESDPGNREVCEALLQLYSDRNLRGDFFRTYTALLGRRLACHDHWNKLAHRFRLMVAANG